STRTTTAVLVREPLLSQKWLRFSATCALSRQTSSNPPWATPLLLRVRCVTAARRCPAGSRPIGSMARRPIASPSAHICGRGLILFFRELIWDRILVVLAGTRGRSLPQNRLLC